MDESLILAIAGERDIQKEYEDIRDVLLQLAESAVAEQATGFDPSGLGSWAEIEGAVSDEVGASGNGLSTENATTISEFSDTEVPIFTHQTDLGEADKIENLQQIFPNFRENTIKFILKESNGDLESAFDQLLNRQSLQEAGKLPKGVEGFYVPENSRSYSRGKLGGGRSRAEKQKKKLDVSYTVVSSTVEDLELEGGSTLTSSSRPTQRLASSARTPLSPVSVSYERQTILKTVGPKAPALPDAADFETSRAHLRSAVALSRLGPLGRQGAVYYIDRAREETRASLARTSSMAEALVNQQSTSSKIDLHGVTVLDGVRIAKHRVWQWWDNLGEGRERIARQQGFTIVTGVGRHSANGISRLRQAVGAALKNDGWKAEALTGQFYITGRLAAG